MRALAGFYLLFVQCLSIYRIVGRLGSHAYGACAPCDTGAQGARVYEHVEAAQRKHCLATMRQSKHMKMMNHH